MGRAASRPEPPSTQIMSRPSPGEAAPVEVGKEALPFDGAFAARQAIVDDFLLAVAPQAQGDQHRTAQRPGSGLAGEHDAVEHQRLVAPGEGPGVEGCDRFVEGLRDVVLYGIAAALPIFLKQNGGHFINLASVGAVLGGKRAFPGCRGLCSEASRISCSSIRMFVLHSDFYWSLLHRQK
jgi:hypothetical protein